MKLSSMSADNTETFPRYFDAATEKKNMVLTYGFVPRSFRNVKFYLPEKFTKKFVNG